MIILYFIPIIIIAYLCFCTFCWQEEYTATENILFSLITFIVVISLWYLLYWSVDLAFQGLFLIATNA